MRPHLADIHHPRATSRHDHPGHRGWRLGVRPDRPAHQARASPRDGRGDRRHRQSVPPHERRDAVAGYGPERRFPAEGRHHHDFRRHPVDRGRQQRHHPQRLQRRLRGRILGGGAARPDGELDPGPHRRPAHRQLSAAGRRRARLRRSQHHPVQRGAAGRGAEGRRLVDLWRRRHRRRRQHHHEAHLRGRRGGCGTGGNRARRRLQPALHRHHRPWRSRYRPLQRLHRRRVSERRPHPGYPARLSLQHQRPEFDRRQQFDRRPAGQQYRLDLRHRGARHPVRRQCPAGHGHRPLPAATGLRRADDAGHRFGRQRLLRPEFSELHRCPAEGDPLSSTPTPRPM